MESNYDLTISIYPDQRFYDATGLATGHEVNRFLDENVEGWKGDPESGGTMMYFYDGQEQESNDMKEKVHAALLQRHKWFVETKREMNKYRK